MTSEQQSADVVVIGCGAGGGVIAKELGESGISVVVLEAGKRFDPARDYPTDVIDFEARSARVFDAPDERRDIYTCGGATDFFYNRVKGVGGSTLHYAAISPRFHESDFRIHTEDGVGQDWPLSYDDLEPYYTIVEQELAVSGPSGADANPFDPPRSRRFPTLPHDFNRASRVLKRGADKLGLHMVREPLAIPTSEWHGRPACINAGTCALGCKIAAKSSIDVTYVPKAEASGKVRFFTECMAYKINLADRKASSVAYLDRDRQQRQIATRAVVLAGNAIETPRLLLMSASEGSPGGLANSSGLVGKYFMEHLTVFSYGVFDERLDPWRGPPSGGMLQDFYASRKGASYARGWTTLVETGQLWPFATARRVSGWGREHKRRMKQIFGHAVALASVGEQLPDLRNEVTLDPHKTDLFGLPAPRLLNEARANDQAMLEAISQCQKDILAAAGAREIWEEAHRPGRSSHYVGTCRMGSDPKTSVVDPWCRSHDVPNLFVGDGSVFVTSAAVNPALTISAIATRTAEGIITAFEEGRL